MRNYRVFIASLLLSGFLLAGCARKVDDTTVVATVNDKPIYLKELKREISNRARQDPSLEINNKTIDDLIDMVIKKQLIIEAAMDKKMAKEQGFVDTIKAFWEQTLIRNFIDYKNREFGRYIFVTDKEIEDFYNELKSANEGIPPREEVREKLKEVIRNKKMSQALEDWLEDRKKKSRIRIHKNVISKAVK